jgi:hypothetical protein
MRLNPFPIIWMSEPARIDLPVDSALAIANLRSHVWRWWPGHWFKDSCTGIISGSRVRLQRYTVLRRNDFSPVLDATLDAQGGPPALRGVWRASWSTRIFLSFWFGMVIAFIPLFFRVAFALWPRDRAGAILSIIGPALLFLFGSATLSFRQRHWNADKAWLERFIAESARTPERP